MTALQIISICILGLGTLVAIGFVVAFVVESLRKDKTEEKRVEKYNEFEDNEINEIDLEAMLAKLEEASKNLREEKVVDAEVVEQEKPAEIKEEVKEEPKAEEQAKEVPEDVKVEDVKEEPVKDSLEEVVEAEEKIEEPKVIVVEENIEEKTEEPKVEELEEITNPEESEEVVEKAESAKEEPTITIINNITAEKSGPEFDYRVRIEKIKESQGRIDRDLEKTTRAILKYERTIRRKERNQKMLDRRALELTNLNLLMYSVTDIKNVDAEKKTRQEELTAHIAELKASIQDAENYLEANKEKHENNLKLRDYLAHEKTRYADEVKELETLIASGKYFDDNVGDDGNKTE